MATSIGRRICVVGTSGSGKTYVAEALARLLGLRYISCDSLIWRAHSMQVPRDEQLEAFDAATRDGEWTFDGNLGPSAEDQLVRSRCDTVIWLDLSRWQVIWSITLRTFWRATTRRPMWHGNVERWGQVFSRDSMILWAWRTHGQQRARYTRLFREQHDSGRTLVRLTSRAAVDAWLRGLEG